MVDDRDIARSNVQNRKAAELARATLVQGDRVAARRCGGKISRFTFTHFSPHGNAMGARVFGFAPINIISINGRRTGYDRLPVTEAEMLAELAIIQARRAAAAPPIRGGANGRPKRVKGRADDLPF